MSALALSDLSSLTVFGTMIVLNITEIQAIPNNFLEKL